MLALAAAPPGGATIRHLLPAHVLAVPFLGVLVLILFSGFSSQAIEYASADAPRTAAVGLLVGGAPALAVGALYLSAPGAALAVVALASFFLLPVLTVAEAYAAVVVGGRLLAFVDVEGRWPALLVGTVALTVAWLAPPVGWIVAVALVVLGVGALARAARDRLARRGVR